MPIGSMSPADGQTIQTMNGAYYFTTLVDATPVVLPMTGCSMPCTVWANPGAASTVRVEYSLDNGTTYRNWPPGDVTAYTESRIETCVTQLRFTRTAGAAASPVGVC